MVLLDEVLYLLVSLQKREPDVKLLDDFSEFSTYVFDLSISKLNWFDASLAQDLLLLFLIVEDPSLIFIANASSEQLSPFSG